MILYLSRNENANLLDITTSENNLHILKVSGSFSLSDFVKMDMRKYASCRYFCIERLAITERDNEFLKALQSFQMMYDARVIVIHESVNDTDSLTRGLIQIGVTDIVTAPDMDDKLEQISECLSVEGMQRYKPKPVKAREHDDEPDEEKETLAQSIILKEMEDEHYRFDCVNVRIGVIGSTRRVGTTTFALGLANFIKNHGGSVCYVALNMNQHLEHIANAYNFDSEEDYFTYDAIDFYEGMLSKHNYNFIITDFGDAKRETTRKYKESDVHLLCGASNKQYEVVEFSEAFKQIKSVKPTILTYIPNPDYGQIFSSTVTRTPTIIKPVRDMLDFKTNGIVFRGDYKAVYFGNVEKALTINRNGADFLRPIYAHNYHNYKHISLHHADHSAYFVHFNMDIINYEILELPFIITMKLYSMMYYTCPKDTVVLPVIFALNIRTVTTPDHILPGSIVLFTLNINTPVNVS